MTRFFTLTTSFCLLANIAFTQNTKNNPMSNHGNKFEQLGTILPTPNEQRTASGAPGAKYWQQKADYNIEATLDEKNLMLIGKEVVTYHNYSPDKLDYLWLQLDENQHNPTNDANFFDSNKMGAPYDLNTAKAMDVNDRLKGLGDQILSVTDELGKPLKYTINQTMMRIDLPKTLMPNTKVKFIVKW